MFFTRTTQKIITATSVTSIAAYYYGMNPTFTIGQKSNTKWQHILGKVANDEQYDHKKLYQFSNDSLRPGLSLCSYPANKPVEDRAAVAQAIIETSNSTKNEHLDIYCVFDGHGGYQVADYASETLVTYLINALRDSHPSSSADSRYVDSNADPSIRFTSALMEAFRRVERDLVVALRPAFELGFGNVARVGACALVCVRCEDDVWIANSGDCVAVLGSSIAEEKEKESDATTKCKAMALSNEHNARHEIEQDKLKAMHPNEMIDGLVRCKSSSSCYVKGHLQPSRSLGDAYLKYQEFRPGLDQNTALLPYTHKDPARSRRVRAPFSPPYVLTDPEVQHVTLTKQDDFLIIASDGLWDEMSPQEAVQFCYEWKSRQQQQQQQQQIQKMVKKESNNEKGKGVVVATSTSTSTSIGLPERIEEENVSISASDYLVQKALEHAAIQSGKSLRDIELIPQGKRRHIHDDITVVVVELKK